MKLVECVPNFSEGRRAGVIENIRKAAESVAGVRVLDCESDRNHNRMVLTFVGTPEPVKNAALASSALAIKEIDLRTHTGEHPRMGAVDVVPFVPISEVTMDDCVALANEFASEFAAFLIFSITPALLPSLKFGTHSTVMLTLGEICLFCRSTSNFGQKVRRALRQDTKRS